MNIHEMYGRQAEQLNELLGSWSGLLQLLGDIRDGRVLPAQLVVTDNGVEVRPVAMPPASVTQDAVSG